MIEMSNVQTIQPRLSGRSMVEMLGVLAIIGVLSITAVAGIRMAMTKHQANLIIEDVKLAGFIIKDELFNTLPSDGSEQDLTGRFTPAANHTYHTFKESDTTYAVVVDGMSERVCLELKKRKVEWLEEIRANGERNVCDASDTNAMSFFFNLDLVTIPPSGEEGDACQSNRDCPTETPFCIKGDCHKCTNSYLWSTAQVCEACPVANQIVATDEDCSICGEGKTFRFEQYCVSCDIDNNYYSLINVSLEECKKCPNRCFDAELNWCKAMSDNSVRKADGTCNKTCGAGQIFTSGSSRYGCAACPVANQIVATDEDCSICGEGKTFRLEQYCVSCDIDNNYYSLINVSLEECKKCPNRYFDKNVGKCNKCAEGQMAASDGLSCI